MRDTARRCTGPSNPRRSGGRPSRKNMPMITIMARRPSRPPRRASRSSQAGPRRSAQPGGRLPSPQRSSRSSEPGPRRSAPRSRSRPWKP
eukprot:12367378-Heterocapsa_arctica.AAC.1